MQVACHDSGHHAEGQSADHGDFSGGLLLDLAEYPAALPGRGPEQVYREPGLKVSFPKGGAALVHQDSRHLVDMLLHPVPGL